MKQKKLREYGHDVDVEYIDLSDPAALQMENVKRAGKKNQLRPAASGVPAVLVRAIVNGAEYETVTTLGPESMAAGSVDSNEIKMILDDSAAQLARHAGRNAALRQVLDSLK